MPAAAAGAAGNRDDLSRVRRWKVHLAPPTSAAWALTAVSIILPTFNRANLLERALSSAVAQSERDWELLVADDGSTDGTWALLGQWQAGDRRVRCWRHSNPGQAASRNRMLGRARGQWIAYLDSDDELPPSHLSTRRQAFEAQPWIDLWLSPMRVVGSPLVPCVVDEGRMMHIDRCVGVGMLLVRREAMLAIGGFPTCAMPRNRRCCKSFFPLESAAPDSARSYIYHRSHANSLTVDRERHRPLPQVPRWCEVMRATGTKLRDGDCAAVRAVATVVRVVRVLPRGPIQSAMTSSTPRYLYA